MIALIATIVASVLFADPDVDPGDIFARLGWPKMESCECRIHVGKGGKWTAHQTRAYGIGGVTSEFLHDFEKMLIDEAADSGLQSSGCSNVEKNRRQCRSEGESDDSLKLASLLVRVFEEDKCNFFRWDGQSFELKFLCNDDDPTQRDEEESVGESVAGMAFGMLLDRVFKEELKRKGVTPAEFKSAMQELGKNELVRTTDGKINADSPAEVSRDGKTLTLDLSKFLSDPPEKWSIRIVGL